ncbi:4-hydroxybenzoate octaprenyltransferase [Salipiger sp. IMCC34102]|uniref:4-hydroxybenzoate octaprenyltransferase n=1 Tax=Salipiger sp. IMCC34102 TaxID=2510647 RepID=UPI00101C35EA|nr:4-hydroxybenzoate octaprenyltransferase [Salipiger sp. IMCC34102]RYH01627.1 4-hydroxybenzoate octaprenyltransferase [Salipiger sp. IMCC34102]
MPPTLRTPEPAVADSTGNWVDTRAPAAWRPYLRLSRFDRPIGTWLLLLPCWWAILLAALWTDSFTRYDLWLFAGSAIGAALMRGAGCTWNDITDRHIDGSVARTRSRPIPSGQVSVKQALAWMIAQCAISFAVLLTFPPLAILVGAISLLPVAIYPFAKRFTWWPQVFLGLAFNWGALLLWTAHAGVLNWPAVVLYLAGIAWTLFYDTIYAHQDAEDDALIGVKSTARLFGDRTSRWLQGFLTAVLVLGGLATLGAVADRNLMSLVLAIGGFWALGWHLTWQLARFDAQDDARLLMLFRSNRDAGLLPLPFFAAALLV